MGQCNYVPSRFEPTIKNFFDPLQCPVAVFGGNSDVVDTIAVKIRDPSDSGKFLQFGNRANAHNLITLDVNE